MTVYVLFREDNGASAGGYVESVHATHALADAARLAVLRQAVRMGERVYIDPDDPSTAEGRDDWTHDWCVDAYEVQTGSAPETITTVIDPELWDAPTCLSWLAVHTREPNHYAYRAVDWTDEVARFARYENVDPAVWDANATAELRQAVRDYKETKGS